MASPPPHYLLLDPGPLPLESAHGSHTSAAPPQFSSVISPATSKFSQRGHPQPAASASGAPPPATLPPGRKAVNPARAAIQQSQGLLQARQKDKFVPLPKGLQAVDSDETGSVDEEPSGPMRIKAYCLADALDLVAVKRLVAEGFDPGAVVVAASYDDCVHVSLLPGPAAPPATPPHGVYLFDFGVVVYVGLDEQQEADFMTAVVYQAMKEPLLEDEVEVDEFHLAFSHTEEPGVKNDTFTITAPATRGQAAKVQPVQLAIVYALAQSIKLNVYEEQVWDLVEDTKHLPRILAADGKVAATPREVARLIGKTFLQQVNVNLQSSVLDTPAVLSAGPDHLQALYNRACEYLELKARVKVLNERFAVLQEMLELLRKESVASHGERLEIVVIFLLFIDTVLMIFSLLSLFGVVGRSQNV